MQPLTIVYICADLVIGLVAVGVNFIVLFVAWRNRTPGEAVGMAFTLNMVVADFMVGFFVAPASAMLYAGQLHHYWGCYTAKSVILAVTFISVLTRTALALERFLAFVKPYCRLSFAMSISLSFTLWPLGVIMAFVPMYFWGNITSDISHCTDFHTKPKLVYFQITVIVLIPFFLMSCAYLYFLVIVHRYRKRARAGQAYAMFIIDKSVQDTLERDMRIAMLVPGVLIIVFFIFLIPFNIMLCFPVICPECHYKKAFFMAGLMLSQTNSLTYPCLMYIVRRSKRNVYRNVKDHLEQIIQMSELKPTLPTDQMVSAANDYMSDTAQDLKQKGFQALETKDLEFKNTEVISTSFLNFSNDFTEKK